jgi:hypothetical protein
MHLSQPDRVNKLQGVIRHASNGLWNLSARTPNAGTFKKDDGPTSRDRVGDGGIPVVECFPFSSKSRFLLLPLDSS